MSPSARRSAYVEPLEPRALLAAADGPDPGFANGITPVLASGADQAYAVSAIAGGGYLVAGKTEGPTGRGLAVVQYRADGKVDATFGRDGQAFVSFDNYVTPIVMAVQPDGKVLLAGTEMGGIAAVVRLLPTGALDRDFGDTGRVEFGAATDFKGPGTIRVRPDGRIVVLGARIGPSLGEPSALLQLTADGRVDASFGGGRAVTFKVGADAVYLSDFEFLPDGGIMAGGSAGNSAVLARVGRDGRLDASFGTGGVETYVSGQHFDRVRVLRDGSVLAVTAASRDAVEIVRRLPDGGRVGLGNHLLPGFVLDVFDVVIQRGGDLILSAAVIPDTQTGRRANGVALARVRMSGELDPSFGDNGIALLDLSPDHGSGVALLARGRLVVTAPGDFSESPSADFTTIGLTRDGRIDPSMGKGGRVTTDILSPETSGLVAAVPLPGGKSLAMGYLDSNATGRLHTFPRVWRYGADGRLDPTFNGGRPLEVNFRGDVETSLPAALAVSAAGDRFAVVGTAYPTDTNRWELGVVAMYHADGTPDAGFGRGGLVQFERPDNNSGFGAARFQGGKLVVAGVIDQGFGLARYNANGSLDRSFGDRGVTVTSFFAEPHPEVNLRYTLAKDFAFDARGNIVVVGDDTHIFMDSPPQYAMAMARYTADGRLDRGFGRGGLVGGLEWGAAWPGNVERVVVQEDGKIVVGGSSEAGYYGVVDQSMVVLRFHADGAPDTAFGSGGRAAVQFGDGADTLGDLVLQPDGKLLLVGSNQDAPDTDYVTRGAVARLDGAGLLDPSFGSGGKQVIDLGEGVGRASTSFAAGLMPDDGHLLVAGTTDGQPALARYLVPDAAAISTSLKDGTLTITGSTGADVIRLRMAGDRLAVSGTIATFDPASFSRIEVAGGAGDDTLDASASPVPVTLDGGDGRDSLLGGSAADLLLGGAGNDTLFGGNGADTLRGGDDNDYLNAGRGADRVFGGDGKDQVYAVDGARDTINGDEGFDRVKSDSDDLLSNAEGLLA